MNYDAEESKTTREHLAERYCVEKLDSDTFPLAYRMIDKYKCKDKELVEKLKHTNYYTKSFCGGRNTSLSLTGLRYS